MVSDPMWTDMNSQGGKAGRIECHMESRCKLAPDDDGMYIDGVGIELVDYKGDYKAQGKVAEVHGLRLNKQERIKDRLIEQIRAIEATHLSINGD